MGKSEWKKKIHENNGGICQVCGRKTKLTVHHKLARCRGGRNSEDNCVSWCPQCHREYHKKWGVATSDDQGNALEDRRNGNRPRKNRKKRKHRRR